MYEAISVVQSIRTALENMRLRWVLLLITMQDWSLQRVSGAISDHWIYSNVFRVEDYSY